MAYEIKCVMCSKSFISSHKEKKCCGDVCIKKRNIEITGRYSDKTITSSTMGAISELEISNDLLKKGYAVFRALSPSCFCDLIAIKDNKILKIEVRTGYKGINNHITFPYNIYKDSNKSDIFGIYIRKSDEILYFKNENKKSNRLLMNL